MEHDRGERGGPDRGTGPEAHRARDEGYQAGGRIQDGQDRGTRLVVVALAAVVGLGVLLAAFRNDGSSLAPLLGDLSPTPTAPPSDLIDPSALPTALPRLGILGAPLPERPIPMLAGWLRWLDPRTGEFQGDPLPADLADQTLTFADAAGNVVQVCTTQATRGGSLVVSVDICAYDADGRQRTHVPVTALRPDPLPRLDGEVGGAPFAIDADVDRRGRWLWIASSVHLLTGWDVTVHRVDLAAMTPAGSRQLRFIPTTAPPAGPLDRKWHVANSSTVRPVVRASPNGSRLSVTITEMLAPGVSVGLLQQERMTFDASLESSLPLDVVFAVGTPSDIACDASRAGWATDHHYLTLCRHSEPNGDIQPFVRIENPFEMTRDVAIGPLIPAADQTFDDSSWLLDVQRGVLHRWSSLHHTITTFDVETRAGTTVALDLSGPPPQTGDWPRSVPGSGPMVWTSLDGGAVASSSALRLAGSADGIVLYALGIVPVDYGGFVQLGSTVAVIDARTDRLVARWDSPGPADQLALAPGGGPLIEFATPRLPQASPTRRGPVLDWTTQAWFVDQRTGTPLEVLGELHGPGATIPVLLPPVIALFAGF